MIRRPIFIVLLLALRVGLASAQAAMVPVSHPVYDWLLEQRIEGRVPTYQHEVRPMSQATIIGHLRTLAGVEAELSRSARNLLADFRNEFEIDRLAAKRGWTKEFLGGLPRSIPGAIRDRLDPVLIAKASKDSAVSGALYYSFGGGGLTFDDGGATSSAYVTTKAVRAYINTSVGLGWSFGWDNIWTKDKRVLIQQLPRYNHADLKPFKSSSFEHEEFLSYRAPKGFEVYAAWANQALGAALTDPLILRGDGPTFGSIRMQFGGPKLNLVYQHGALFAPYSDDTTGTPSMPVPTRTAPDRFFVGHRLTWMPSTRLSLSVHEQTIYANRGPDLTYSNPAAIAYLVQLRTGDRDNLSIGGDAVYRPWNGTELRGSFILDDRSATNPDAGTFGPFKKAFLVAAEQRVVSGVRAGVSYTAIDPWAYAHWQRLTTYESEGKPLGPLMGPNAEELAARVTAWLPLRTRVMAGVRRIKKGLDPVAADTNFALCVGGNLFCGSLAKETPLFQGADVHVVNRFEAEALTEPIKGFPVTFALRDDRVVRGTRINSTKFVDFRIRVGF